MTPKDATMTHGGRRRGAGRIARYDGGATVAHTFRLPPGAMDLLDRVRKKFALKSRSHALERVLEDSDLTTAMRAAFRRSGE